MKATDLHAIWAAPDNSRLTSKQSSFRLPVHVAAKLNALCELYPNKSKTQLVGDLLAAAIDASLEALPSKKGRVLDVLEDSDGSKLEVVADVGPWAQFRKLANQHYAELEGELGNESPQPLYPYEYTAEGPGDKVEAFVYSARRGS